MLTQKEQKQQDVLYGLLLRMEFARDDKSFRFPQQRIQFLHEVLSDCIAEARECLEGGYSR